MMIRMMSGASIVPGRPVFSSATRGMITSSPASWKEGPRAATDDALERENMVTRAAVFIPSSKSESRESGCSVSK